MRCERDNCLYRTTDNNCNCKNLIIDKEGKCKSYKFTPIHSDKVAIPKKPKSNKRNNPNYPPYHEFTTMVCEICGEHYEPYCRLEHICYKQNSYPVKEG